MKLDFTTLDSLQKQGAKIDFSETLEDEEGTYTLEVEKPATSQNKGHTHQLDREVQERERLRAVYSAQADNMHKAGSIRSDLLKGMKRAEPPLALLLKAMECISYMTGDTLIYNQSKEYITTIYGYGLGEVAPLHLRLKEIQARIDKLSRPNILPEGAPDTDRQRINNAIHALRDEEEALQKKIKRG